MKEGNKKVVVWLYSDDHLRHPFICIAAESLMNHGYSLTVIDKASEKAKQYDHIPLYPPLLSESGNLISLLIKALQIVTYEMMALWRPFCNTLRRSPSLIIVTMPQMLVIGWIASRILRARLVYYPFELYGEQCAPARILVKRLERLILKRGIDGLITQNEERAKVYQDERGARVRPVIVHNYKPLREVTGSGKLRKSLKLSETDRIVLYEGMLVQGRWLDKLIQSATYLHPDAKLVFMGKDTPWWRESAGRLLTMPGIVEKVLVAPYVSQDELLSYVADADVGVIIYDDKVRNNYYCEPGKLSDYVIAGVPLIVPDFPTIAPVVRQHGIGAVFNNPEPEEIARVVNSVLATPKQVWQTALEKARKDLVWETQLPGFLMAISGEPS
ncbi:MAG: glycosyltransferase [Nitrospirae bacterium]|nr:glycosyltransferase [Nitrospirota bacterium]